MNNYNRANRGNYQGVDPLDITDRIIAIGKKMYDKGYIVASDGNISVRIAENALLVTASGVCKGEMTRDDIIECDLNGKSASGRQVTSEIAMHLAVYRLREDVHAVIHAHPPYAVALSLRGLVHKLSLLPEVTMALGDVRLTEYAAPSSREGAVVVSKLITRHSALILDRHGSLTVGGDLVDAYWKLERLEYASKVVLVGDK